MMKMYSFFYDEGEAYRNIDSLNQISNYNPTAIWGSNPYDAKGLLKTSIRDDDPVIFMESELMYGDKGNVPEQEYLIPIGKSNVVHEGNDVTLVSFGKMMKVAEETFNIAKKEI